MRTVLLNSTMVVNNFENRQEAGRLLAEKLKKYAGKNSYVLAVPRGGVVVGYEVAKRLKLPLDILVVRKIGHPFDPELAIGAVAEGVIEVLDDEIDVSGISPKEIRDVVDKERLEVKRRQHLYRDDRPLADMAGKTVLIIDDGLATGYTAIAAVDSARRLHPSRLVFSVPVCAEDSIIKIKNKVDDFVCLLSTPDLRAVGEYYLNFNQVTDDQVVSLLNSSRS